jgi:hypothetical protein
MVAFFSSFILRETMVMDVFHNTYLITFCINFHAGVDDWCLQHGTQDQYIKCGSSIANGLICYNPEIQYGSTTGGIPCNHGCKEYGQLCQQLVFSGYTNFHQYNYNFQHSFGLQ